ncbi:MAG: cupin [Pseudomonadota bacterium]
MRPRPHIEFVSVPSTGWDVPDGYPETITQHILVDTLDHANRTGERMLVMRFAPGARTGTTALSHDECEDVFVYEGDLIVYDPHDQTESAAKTFHAPAFATRPGGVAHGPFGSAQGCLMLVRFSYPQA